MQPTTIAYLICFLPLISIHGCWLWSSGLQLIPWCNPYWDGCVSISKAARVSDAIYLFKASMIFSAGYMVIYWQVCQAFLRREVKQRAHGRIVSFLGVTGAIFLVLYATYLGTEGDIYRLMRRYGVIIYFTFTALAQMIFYRSLKHYPEAEHYPPITYMLVLLSGILIVGLVSLGATLTQENPAKDRWENTTEWWFALMMTLNFGLTGWLWKRVRFRL
ncbi:hypothetical protein [Hahella ganghwensis]|uniref:hypothetical protein n=1 Tax=Hahella ganghwensis TaxID=286420 RepID=UPI0003739112|nr:hypothetical protein [Hahella ganghwensis]